MARLDAYLELLGQWQKRTNLVGPSTLADPWRRHILDAAQLCEHIPLTARNLADLGSGAGLPGLILAILGVPNVTLVEADRRKAVFLREAARVTGCTAVEIICERIEKLSISADVITARALAPLAKLLGLAVPTPGHRRALPVSQGPRRRARIDRCPRNMDNARRPRSQPNGHRGTHSGDRGGSPCPTRHVKVPAEFSLSPTRKAASARPRPRSIWQRPWPRRGGAFFSSTSTRKAMPAPVWESTASSGGSLPISCCWARSGSERR